MSDRVEEASLQYQAELTESVVPAGYKQTEVGVIPEDWDVCTLGEAMTLQRGFDLPQRLRQNGMVPIVSSSGISGSHDRAMVAAPGIVTGRYGTIGEIFYVTEAFWPLNTTLYVREFKKVTPHFAYHSLKRVDFKSHSGKSGVPGVNRNDVHQEIVPIPSGKEQTAIANALSDVDALISEQENLIAKKQAIKTATMQQLLTGRTRLPAFAQREDGTAKGFKQSELGEVPEDWEVFRFDENFDIYAGGDVPKNSLSNIRTQKFPYPIFANAISKNGLYGFTGYKRSKPDSLTITARGYLGHAEYRDEFYFPIVRLLVLEPLGALDSKLTAYAINELIEFPIESTGVPQLTAPDVGKYSIAAPNDVDEQVAIASILSEIDIEIRALERLVDKTRQIKQGMMQELLTGRTRLVTPEVTQ